MIYYTINKIIDQDEDGWITSEQIVYDDGRSITFKDLKSAEKYYSRKGFNKSTHYLAIHDVEEDGAAWDLGDGSNEWVKERFWDDT
tara:strand:- start:41 stop:298 length:258 start_codon:yes stop_codon:yes gene_type:complete